MAQPSAPAATGAGGAGEPPAAPTPDPAPPPAPQETEKGWAIAPAHFRDDDAAIWAETSNRSDPFAWDRITAGNAAAVRVSIDGERLPLENLSYPPVFDDDFSGAEWQLKAEVTVGAVVLALTAEDRSYPTGEVRSVTLTDGGSGYTSAPTVTFSPAPAGGSDATGTAAGPFGLAVTVTNEGDYASAPNVTFSAPTGVGATATGSVSITGVVKVLGLLTQGSGYTSAAVSITGDGSGATAGAEIGYVVTSVTVIDPGSGYTSAPTVTFSGGNPSPAATAIAALNDRVTSVTLTDPGSGYAAAPTVTFDNTGSGGSGAAARAKLARRGYDQFDNLYWARQTLYGKQLLVEITDE